MADKTKPTPTDGGKAEAKGVIQRIFANFKSLIPESAWNEIVSILDPIFDESAEAVADRLKKRLPKDSWLKSWVCGSVIGVISATIEDAAQKFGEPTKVALQKASDWIKTFGRRLRGKDSETPATPKVTERDSKALEAFVESKKKFLESARMRMETAPSAEKSKVASDILIERDLFAKVEKVLLEGPEPIPEAPKPPGKPFMEHVKTALDGVGEALEPVNDAIEEMVVKCEKAQADKAATEPPKKPDWVGQIGRSILKGIFP
ncbi:MAG: hypothetical protein ABI430_02470 [Candidatus Taylorbacteria bacterium]